MLRAGAETGVWSTYNVVAQKVGDLLTHSFQFTRYFVRWKKLAKKKLLWWLEQVLEMERK